VEANVLVVRCLKQVCDQNCKIGLLNNCRPFAGHLGHSVLTHSTTLASLQTTPARSVHVSGHWRLVSQAVEDERLWPPGYIRDLQASNTGAATAVSKNVL
jgi:hypothetical protein